MEKHHRISRRLFGHGMIPGATAQEAGGDDGQKGKAHAEILAILCGQSS
jgi:hypothetical protein